MIWRTIQRQADLLLATSLCKCGAFGGSLMVLVPLNQCKDGQLQNFQVQYKPVANMFFLSSFLANANFKGCKKSPPIKYRVPSRTVRHS
jgi:hypothetical protein